MPPPDVSLAGAGHGANLLDGEGAQNLSLRPVQEGQSCALKFMREWGASFGDKVYGEIEGEETA
jgi:hypothetical protein